jgi:hypothetical protein
MKKKKKWLRDQHERTHFGNMVPILEYNHFGKKYVDVMCIMGRDYLQPIKETAIDSIPYFSPYTSPRKDQYPQTPLVIPYIQTYKEI